MALPLRTWPTPKWPPCTCLLALRSRPGRLQTSALTLPYGVHYTSGRAQEARVHSSSCRENGRVPSLPNPLTPGLDGRGGGPPPGPGHSLPWRQNHSPLRSMKLSTVGPERVLAGEPQMLCLCRLHPGGARCLHMSCWTNGSFIHTPHDSVCLPPFP